ncbi:Kdo domain containing protein [Flavobacterium sp.]|uniref:Kdo domain containing protein n=1 Tax=Flavobacterium sp. TaxID=239 RepID=UPI003D128041
MYSDTLEIIQKASSLGEDFAIGSRNQIKTIEINHIKYSVKVFKVPYFLLGFIYRYFRKSKAERSYLHAVFLESKKIGTPKPIGFYENKSWFRLKESYYVCEHLENSFLFRDLFNTEQDDLDKILRGFAKFTYQMHECGIEFLDHSPGNTLIKNNKGTYDFFLVDLNRMNIHKEALSFDKRMKNFERILTSNHYREIVSDEYAKLYNKPYDVVFKAIEGYSLSFFKKFDNKRKIKNLFKI